MDETGATYLSFASPEEAKIWIRRLAGKRRFLGHTEGGPPTFTIVKLGTKVFFDAFESTFGSAE